MTDTNKIAAYLRRDAMESFLGVLVPPADALALLDERDRLVRERDHLSLQVCNAQAGDCMSGEHGTIECPVDKPCGVCKLRGERDNMRTLLRRVSTESLVDVRYASDGAHWDGDTFLIHRQLLGDVESALAEGDA